MNPFHARCMPMSDFFLVFFTSHDFFLFHSLGAFFVKLNEERRERVDVCKCVEKCVEKEGKNHMKCHFASAQLWKTMNIPLEIVNERISAIVRDQLFIRRKHNNAECSNGAFLLWQSAQLAAAHGKETSTQNDKESPCYTLIIHILR